MMKFIRHEALVTDLLRCSELQRLRRIRQLGFGCFVFPGAEHSRFCHAVGAAYIAAQVGRHLDSVAREILPESISPDVHALQEFCVAGLCHDIGHGPFSHVWERVVVGEGWDRTAWAGALGVDGQRINTSFFRNWHEMVTYAMLVSPTGQLHTILEQNAAGSSQRVADLLVGNYYLPYLSRLLSGDIDVDRADYLLRDARMAGLPSCGFQLDRLIASLTFGFDEEGRCWAGIHEEKGLAVAIELLNARAELHEVLYYHRTILGMEWLLGNLLTRLRDLNLNKGLELSSGGAVPKPLLEMIAGRAVDLDGVMALDDYAIWMLVARTKEITGGDPTAVGLAKRIMERDPLRAVRAESQRVQAFFAKDHRARDEMVKNIVSKFVEGEAHYFYKEVPVAFELWEKDAKGEALLVSQTRPARVSPLSDHPRLRKLFPEKTHSLGVILLVPREAREEVERLINS